MDGQEKIDSLFDAPAIQKEVQELTFALKAMNAQLMDPRALRLRCLELANSSQRDMVGHFPTETIMGAAAMFVEYVNSGTVPPALPKPEKPEKPDFSIDSSYGRPI